eukprot:1185547-Prorocentrum_minimum.AAC.3
MSPVKEGVRPRLLHCGCAEVITWLNYITGVSQVGCAIRVRPRTHSQASVALQFSSFYEKFNVHGPAHGIVTLTTCKLATRDEQEQDLTSYLVPRIDVYRIDFACFRFPCTRERLSAWGMSPPITVEVNIGVPLSSKRCISIDSSLHGIAVRLGRSLAADDVFGTTNNIFVRP